MFKTIVKQATKGTYYLCKGIGQFGAIVKEGVVDGYSEAIAEIRKDECPFEEKEQDKSVEWNVEGPTNA